LWLSISRSNLEVSEIAARIEGRLIWGSPLLNLTN
jgi:hypothetical protein